MNNQKIVIDYLDKNNEFSKELIWGEMYKIDQYFVRSIPFFAPNLAFDDLIQVEIDDKTLYFDDLIKPSNNSTLRIVFFNNDIKCIEKILTTLESYLCDWKGFESRHYYTINIPKKVDYALIKKYLDDRKDFLDYEESCLSDKHLSDLF
ncbi:DUF4265 domain-containing protein [Acinetobacter baumannii]|uniref:DUF4265 domain-containing protein n=1 Tax=Acinetobacter baumannii TaxID=470 RepID=UPI0010A8C4EB|nr:DUF4265 domain-containing protein [Acinetobacter baumannii]MCF4554248.1 DUF4265 domain-containing protein [Acinetobacter baumannii]MCF4586702.1 DUF4265 domain-containing protein [Acinetobacter baumannii]MCF4627149.1 DUF4265 domain-containing protein [Acinetobacter baumannii]THV11495.1 DUF4265 domain-containing protein [Acinetobacter baumannii]HCQ9864569.1 DUF4265 domain-containing protein [Acinetobacter baumannii]